MINQEMKLAETFVELADTLVDDFDVIDFLHTLCARSSEIFNAEGAGLLLSSQRGDLQVLAATDEQTRQLELFQLEENTGPCLDCYYQEKIVVANDADELTRRWPTFGRPALDAGFVSGVVAERYGIGMDEAFAALRRHARSNNLRLSHVATQVTNGDLEIGRLGHQ
jgi:hypothetical protein